MTRIFRNIADVFLKITVADEQEPIQVTLGYPFYVHQTPNDLSGEDDEGEWILSKDLRVGDLLKFVRSGGSSYKIQRRLGSDAFININSVTNTLLKNDRRKIKLNS